MKTNINIIQKINLLLLFCISFSIVFAVEPEYDLRDITRINYGNGWLEFKKELNIQSSTIFDDYKTAFELGLNDNMNITRIDEDNIGFTHYRFQQTYKGIRVEGAEYIVHEKDNKAVRGNGKIVNGLDLNVNPAISQSQAIDIAMQAVPAEKYKWEDENTTYYPQPKLLITYFNPESSRFITDPEFFKLAYKVNIYTVIPHDGKAVYVDAKTGEMLKIISLISNSNCESVEGTAITLYNGEQNINTLFDMEINEYILYDDCRGAGIETVFSSTAGQYEQISNPFNTWGEVKNYATQAHWAAMMTHDYFAEKHERQGIYNDEFIVHQRIIDCELPPSGARYVRLGPNDDYHPGYVRLYKGDHNLECDLWWTTLEIVGHEWTHGVSRYSVSPDEYGGGFSPSHPEPKALNESFSDIFSKMIVFYVMELNEENFNYDNISSDDFEIGEIVGGKRHMCDPHIFFDACTYEATCWDNNLSEHALGGVQNKWFCLLSIGGSGENCHGDNYDIEGIGIEKAAEITYSNLTTNMMRESNYSDARKGSIYSAKEIYGNCSPEVIQVVRAWNAVGVYGHLELEVNLEICSTFTATQDPYILEATNEILAGKVVYEQCQTIIEPGANVVFKAGNRIVLGQGFHAKAGSSFRAFIDPCIEVSQKSLLADNQSVGGKDEMPDMPKSIENKHQDFLMYPNPFNTYTNIKYHINENEFVNISLYDINGIKLKTLINEKKHPSGEYTVKFDRKDLDPGIYFCIFRTNSKNITKKMIIL